MEFSDFASLPPLKGVRFPLHPSSTEFVAVVEPAYHSINVVKELRLENGSEHAIAFLYPASRTMTISEFIKKWSKSQLTEGSAAQQHFLELCELFQHPKPADVDLTGESYTFEKGVAKQDGGKGWADVWKKGFFGWEHTELEIGVRLGPSAGGFTAGLDLSYARL